MEQGITTNRWWRAFGYAVGMGLILSPGLSWGLEVGATPPAERRETISLADAALQALKHNLDISISRQTKESRQADITVEQAKFDPTLSVNGQYNRTVNPLNRPVFGFSQGTLNNIQTFDQRNHSVTLDATANLPTGGNVDLNYSPSRTNVSGAQACFGQPPNTPGCTGGSFLFNPSWTGGLALTLTQPLLRNAGFDVTKTFIRVAQNNAFVEEHVFRDRVLTVLASVEQTYWEVVFANENLKVAEAALKAAQELLATNRAKASARSGPARSNRFQADRNDSLGQNHGREAIAGGARATESGAQHDSLCPRLPTRSRNGPRERVARHGRLQQIPLQSLTAQSHHA
ncbi:MAG: TolC family protein [Nitrospira sp.]|nr:MAG: TolC family protein [Nitrospira sp.]